MTNYLENYTDNKLESGESKEGKSLDLSKIEQVSKYKWINTHSDYGMEVLNQQRHFHPEKFRNSHLQMLKKNGVMLEVVQAGGDFPVNNVDGHSPTDVYDTIDAIYQACAMNSDACMLVKSRADLELMGRSEKIGIMLSMEGSSAIDPDFRNLRNFHRLGVRALSITHNERNIFGDGLSVKNPGGLSPYGENFVRELNQMDMILDLVHISAPCFDEIMEIYEKAPINSHATAKAVYDCYRGTSDDQIRAIADRNGFIGVNFIGQFIGPEKERKVTVEDIVNHVDHFVDKAGIDRVGLGPDWVYYMEDGWDKLPYAGGLRDESGMGIFFEALDKRGYSEQEIAKLAYLNYMEYLKRSFPQ